MRVWRLSRAAHLGTALTGLGAKRYGGRWNSRGVAVVYASESLELALLEAIVHLDIDLLPNDYWWLCLEFDDAQIAAPPKRLPPGWDALPPYPPAVQAIGDRWLKGSRSLAMRVPASVLPERFNVLINPSHPAMTGAREVERAKLKFPPRLAAHLKGLAGK